MTLVDLYRNIYRLHTVKQFNSSDLSLLFVLIGEWNEQRRPEWLLTSRQTLQELSSLPESNARRVIQKLISYRIIETAHERGMLLIKIRPLAEWRYTGENMTETRRKDEPKPASQRTKIRPIESRAENAHARENEDDTPVSLADILKERRRASGNT